MVVAVQLVKRCARCQEDKPASAFSPRRRASGGLHSYCRDCNNAYCRANRADPTKARDYRCAALYGMAAGEYDRLLAEQRGGCAVCGSVGNARGLHVDHCHTTGEIRGLLCHHCNVALGNAADDPVRLRALADYLERSWS